MQYMVQQMQAIWVCIEMNMIGLEMTSCRWIFYHKTLP